MRDEPVVDMDEWATLLTELMKSSGVTALWLAGEVGVDEKTVGRWRNRRFPPKPENVRDVARALGYPPLQALARVGFLRPEEAGLAGEPIPVPPPLPGPLRRAADLLSSERIPTRARDVLLKGLDATVEMWIDTYRSRAPREPSASERGRPAGSTQGKGVSLTAQGKGISSDASGKGVSSQPAARREAPPGARRRT